MKLHRNDKEKLVDFVKRAMNVASLYGNKVIRAIQGNRETLVYPCDEDHRAILQHMTIQDRLNQLEGLSLAK